VSSILTQIGYPGVQKPLLPLSLATA